MSVGPPLVASLVLGLLLSLGITESDRGPVSPYRSRSDTDTVAQDVAFISGRSLVGGTEGGVPIQRFTGDVTGVQDSTFLAADRATRYLDSGLYVMVGNVSIVDLGDTLTADTVRYRESVKVGRATGSVRLSDGTVEVLAPEGVYDVDERRAEFSRGLQLEDSAGTVRADSGVYWMRERRAEVEGNVRYRGDDMTLRADSLASHRDDEVAEAFGNVWIQSTGAEEDSAQTIVFGDWVYSDGRTQEDVLRGNVLMVQLQSDSAGTDTLALLSDRLKTVDADTTRQTTAVGAVRYWSGDIAATADSMISIEHTGRGDNSEEIWLFGSPVMWSERAQVSGDTVRVVTVEGQADTVFVWGNAFMAQEDTVLGRINQARGRALVALFEEDSVRTFQVGPNAEVVFFRRTEEDGPDGAIQVSGDEATLVVAGDEPKTLTFGEHEGTYHPEEVLALPLELDGFRWVPLQRPMLPQFLHDPRFVAWTLIEGTQ